MKDRLNVWTFIFTLRPESYNNFEHVFNQFVAMMDLLISSFEIGEDYWGCSVSPNTHQLILYAPSICRSELIRFYKYYWNPQHSSIHFPASLINLEIQDKS